MRNAAAPRGRQQAPECSFPSSPLSNEGFSRGFRGTGLAPVLGLPLPWSVELPLSFSFVSAETLLLNEAGTRGLSQSIQPRVTQIGHWWLDVIVLPALGLRPVGVTVYLRARPANVLAGELYVRGPC